MIMNKMLPLKTSRADSKEKNIIVIPQTMPLSTKAINNSRNKPPLLGTNVTGTSIKNST